jgi:hypothetical protein
MTEIEIDTQWDYEQDLLIDYEEDSVWIRRDSDE